MRLLFVCTMNKYRSATAEKVFSSYSDHTVKSAGTDSKSVNILTDELIDWAEVILVMEKSHRNRILKKFPVNSKNKRIFVLNIPDDYEYMEPALVNLLKLRISEFIQI